MSVTDAPKGDVRLFVSVEVPEGLRLKAAALSRELPQDAIIPVKPENMHLTLRFMGEVPATEIVKIERKLRGVRFGRFKVRLTGTGVFPNSAYVRVIWVGCFSPELEALASEVMKATHGIGKEDERGFSAHLTIARVRQKIDAGPFLARHAGEEFGEFEVSSFRLMRSVLGSGGPEYGVLAEFVAVE